jgi:DNA-directed RNA polymerase specialized sigma24 family protein
MELKDCVNYAMRVANRMTQDPEGLSLANQAAWRAFRTYDPSLGVPMKRWVARLVKLDIWCYWRTRKDCRTREGQLNSDWWMNAYTVLPEESDLPEKLGLSQLDWQILVEKFVEEWPYDVVAKMHGCTTSGMKRHIKALVARLR